MNNIKVDLLVDAKGLSCPMPIVKIKKGMTQVQSGQVVELEATDKGSLSDIKAWADSTGNQYLGTLEVEGIYKHYIRKSSSDEENDIKYPIISTNENLMTKLDDKEDIQLVDVRENAEYAFAHIPSAISIPLGILEDELNTLDKDKEIYVICRSGHRSDLAAQILTEKGFKKVVNVVPGMGNWTGNLETLK